MSAKAGSSATTFSALRHPAARWYFGALVVSNVGTWMQGTAIAWLVLKTLNGTGNQLGFNTALQTLPLLVLGPFAGVLADRWKKRRMVFITQGAAAILAGILTWVDFIDAETLLRLNVLAFCQGIVFAIDAPPRRALIGELVPLDDLSNAMSLNTACITGARILGPGLAGIVINEFGTAWCFLVNAISYVAILIALVFMRPDPQLVRRTVAKGGDVFHELAEGIAHVWKTPILRLILAALAVAAAFSFNQNVTVPLLVTRTFGEGSKTFGFLLTAMSVGSLAGTLFVARRRHTVALAAQLLLMIGITNLLFGFAPQLWMAFVVAPALGAATSTFIAVTSGVLMANSDPALRGRILSLQTTAFLGIAPLGSPVVGLLVDHTSPAWGFALGGVVALGVWAFVSLWDARQVADGVTQSSSDIVAAPR